MKIKHNPEDLNKINVVYQIECLITGNKYIGETKNLKTRISQHLGCHSKSTKSGCHRRTNLYVDAQKYGWENFKLTVLAENICDKKLRLEFEKLCKDRLGSEIYLQQEQHKDTRKKRDKFYCKFSNGKEIKIFTQPIFASRYFSRRYNKVINRTTILQAIKNKCLFNGIWKVEYISETEYRKLSGINQLF